MWLIKNFYRHELCRQFVKFCLVGAANAVIDYTIYLLLTRGAAWYFLYANIAAILVAMTSSFVFNKYWTFRNHEKKIRLQSFKFFLVNLVYFGLNNSIVFLLVHFSQVYDLAAKVIAIFIGLFWNFTANRYWTFKQEKPVHLS